MTRTNNLRLLSFTLLAALFLFSCEGFEIPEEAFESLNEPDNINTWLADESFSYETTHEIEIQLDVKDNQGKAVSKVPLKIYSLENKSSEPQYVYSSMTDENGILTVNAELNNNIKYLLIDVNYPGYPNNQLVEILGSAVTYSIDPRVTPLTLEANTKSTDVIGKSAGGANLNFNYIGTFSSNGVPDYLESVNESIGQNILDLLAASLPEGQPVPSYNPQYISSGNGASVILDQQADLWITFIHEGAGYRNSVGYYSSPTSNPPATREDIQNLNIIFPNTSFSGSGGGLTTGNKVYLGSFSAGTTVGWFLIPDGWNSGSQTVSEKAGKDAKFSNTGLNTFTNPEYRSHSVILEDPDNEALYLGFEDINRPSGDNDFNDAIFLIQASPFSAINTTDLSKVQSSLPDSDGDGAPDNSDNFINDPDIAFVSYMPGENMYGTLAFEDRWPSTGDYDLNDIVVDYNFTEFRNSNNLVIKTRAVFVLKAMGAGLQNGFGFETNLNPSSIQSVTGYQHSEGIISLNSNGTESNQSKAVIIVFDNGYNIMNNPGGFVNTEIGQSLVEPDTITIDIEYTSPIPAGQIGSAPYNAFIFTGLRRAYEVHLPDKPGTSLADVSLYQSLSDDSDPSTGKYYKTVNNLPWALNLPAGFDYPIEKSSVQKAYNHFQKWVLSSGNEFPDWYYDNAGYREAQFIY